MFIGLSVEALGLLFAVLVSCIGAINWLLSALISYLEGLVSKKIRTLHLETKHEISEKKQQLEDDIDKIRDDLRVTRLSICSDAKISRFKRHSLIQSILMIEEKLEMTKSEHLLEQNKGTTHPFCNDDNFNDL